MTKSRTTVLALAAACTSLPAAVVVEGTAHADGLTTPTAPTGTATTTTTSGASTTTAPTPPTTQAPPLSSAATLPAPHATVTVPASPTTTAVPARPAAPAAAARPADATTPYYGNPKVSVQVSPTNPGQYPVFPATTGDPALGFFAIQGATTTGTVNGSCVTAGLGSTSPGNGECEMDNETSKFPMTSNPETFDFSVASAPPGWVVDPSETVIPQLEVARAAQRADAGSGVTIPALVYACGPDPGTDDCSSNSETGTFVQPFDLIGLWRTLQTTVTSQITGAPLAGVTVHLSCTPPAGVPSGEPTGYACPTSVPDVTTDSNGQATFSGLFVPGATVALTTTSGLPSPYTAATSSTLVPSPVTAATTTGAEIDAATKVPVDLPLTPTGPLPDYTGTTPENTPYTVKGIGQNTAYGNLTPTSVSQPSHGAAKLNADGTVTYTPATGFVGTDTFTYTAVGTSSSSSTTSTTVASTTTSTATQGARTAVTARTDAAPGGGTGTVTMTVTPLPTTAAAAASPPPATSTAAATAPSAAPAAPASALAFTGADIAGTVAAGGVLIGAGTILTRASRRRRRRAGGAGGQ
jgi:hypothetical protein